MEYHEDVQKASELTRMILPALAKLEIPINILITLFGMNTTLGEMKH